MMKVRKRRFSKCYQRVPEGLRIKELKWLTCFQCSGGWLPCSFIFLFLSEDFHFLFFKLFWASKPAASPKSKMRKTAQSMKGETEHGGRGRGERGGRGYLGGWVRVTDPDSQPAERRCVHWQKTCGKFRGLVRSRIVWSWKQKRFVSGLTAKTNLVWWLQRDFQSKISLRAKKEVTFSFIFP